MSSAKEIKQLFADYVVPSYGRFDLVFDHGQGSYLWDISKDVEIKGSLYLYGIFKDRVTGEVSDSFFLGCLDNANGK